MTDAYAAALAKASKAAERKKARMAARLNNKYSEAAKRGMMICSDGYVCPKKDCFETAKHSHGNIKRKKSPSLSKLKKMLWTEISLLVRSWSPVCVACLINPTECAGHVVPANSGGATAYFLANLVPMCFSCNGAELRHRGEWVYRFKSILGDDVVDALYLYNKESKDRGWQFKKNWVLEQIERMKKLRGING